MGSVRKSQILASCVEDQFIEHRSTVRQPQQSPSTQVWRQQVRKNSNLAVQSTFQTESVAKIDAVIREKAVLLTDEQIHTPRTLHPAPSRIRSSQQRPKTLINAQDQQRSNRSHYAIGQQRPRKSIHAQDQQRSITKTHAQGQKRPPNELNAQVLTQT